MLEAPRARILCGFRPLACEHASLEATLSVPIPVRCRWRRSGPSPHEERPVPIFAAWYEPQRQGAPIAAGKVVFATVLAYSNLRKNSSAGRSS